MQIAAAAEEDLVDEMGQIHIRVAAGLAENSSALQGLVGSLIQFPEQLYPLEFKHIDSLSVFPPC